MAKKKVCRICGYENNANASSCGMCGADFGLELNFEEMNSDDEDMLSDGTSNFDMPNSSSNSGESSSADSQSPNNSEWKPVYLKRMWSKGVSKFLSVIIVFTFLVGVTVYFFQTSDKMQRYRIVYKHMLEINDGNVWKTVNQIRGMDGITLYRYAEEYGREKVQETLDADNEAVKTKDNREKNSKNKKKNNKKKSKKASKDKSGYIFVNSNKRYLRDKELKKLSKEKLSIARNEIYARAGRRFTTKKWKNYFKKKKWYVPKYSAKYFDRHEKKLFNKYERANVKKIKKIEKKRGR